MTRDPREVELDAALAECRKDAPLGMRATALVKRIGIEVPRG